MIHFCCGDKHLIQKAKTRRKVKPTYNKLAKLSDMMGNAVSVHLLKGIKSFRKDIDKNELAAALKKGPAYLMREIPWEKFPVKIGPAIDGIVDAQNKAIKFSTEALPPNVNAGLRMDMSSPYYHDFVNTRIGELIQNVTADTQGIVQDAVAQSMNNALTPREVADKIVDSIGLNDRQANALDNYETSLRDQGYPETQISDMVDEYNDRLLSSRAMTIARTETRAATNNGQLLVWQEAASQGLIDKAKAMKVWIVDGNPCPVCEPMDGIAVPLDGFWTLNTGETVDLPNQAHPNCYCGMELDFGDTGGDGDGPTDEDR